MHILVVSQYWPPEMGAPASRFYDFGRQWVAEGHRVSVVTGFPNFPAGQIHEPYRGKIYQHEVMDGIDVYRTFIYASPRLTKITKGLGYLSYMLSASLFVLLCRLKYDVVIATAPPPTVGLPGLLARLKRRVPMVFEVRDLWPEAIVLAGKIKNPLLIRALEYLEMLLYRKAALVSVVTNGKRDRLIERGVPGDKVVVLWNGVDFDAFDRESEGSLPPDFDALDPDARWFTYAGVFNPSQGLDIILEAADKLRRDRPDLYSRAQFVMVGGGPERNRLLTRLEEMNLDRVHFIPIQPRSAIYRLLRRSFGILILLRPRQDDHTVPSKIFESLASERPIILSAAGEVASIISDAEGGPVTEPGSADALYDAIVELMEDPQAADRAGRNGRTHVVAHFDRRKTAMQFVKKMAELSEKRSGLG